MDLWSEIPFEILNALEITKNATFVQMNKMNRWARYVGYASAYMYIHTA